MGWNLVVFSEAKATWYWPCFSGLEFLVLESISIPKVLGPF